MNHFNRETVTRLALLVVILLFGVAMIPFVDLPKAALGWEQFAGIYMPTLDINAPSGAPGSVFTLKGGNYPPNSAATIYIDGVAVGSVTTDGSGSAAFLIDTRGSSPGVYNVTMEVDVNASATQTFELLPNAPIVPPPGNFNGPTFFSGEVGFLPYFAK